MGMCDSWSKKLSQATCDKIEFNKCVLRLRKSFKEAEKALCGDQKKKK